MIESDFEIFESIGALVVVLDTDGRIVYWNGACSRLTGYWSAAARSGAS
jgi:PAS domain S-box-containing protein